MRWIRFTPRAGATGGGNTAYGILEGDRIVEVAGTPFASYDKLARTHQLGDVKIELPVVPPTFYAVGFNYFDAAVCSALAFPQPHVTHDATKRPVTGIPLPRVVWFAVFGVACMALVQAMIFSFVERIGTDRGFGFQAVSGVLIALGLVNLTPSPLAVFLQKHWPAHRVVLFGPLAQAIIALTITLSTSYVPYAVATCLFAGVMIFTHNFAFGLLASLDSSGRAVAATPAMLMVGAAIGPVLGGTLVKAFGYGSLGLVAAVFAALAMVSFWRVRPAVAAAKLVPA